MRSFKSNENIHKKEGGSYYVVSANKASSVNLQTPGNESQSQVSFFFNFRFSVEGTETSDMDLSVYLHGIRCDSKTSIFSSTQLRNRL